MALDLISGINTSGIYAQYASSAEKDSLGRVISATYLTSADLTAALNPYANLQEVANTFSTLSGTIDDKFLTKSGASATYLEKEDFDTWSATLDTKEYSAGANINITNHVISGKDWTNEINAASSNAYDAATAYVAPMTAASAEWNTASDWVENNSANITSVSSTVASNSGNWEAGSTWAADNSANITSVSSTVTSNSAYWSSGYSGLQWITANSANITSVSSTVTSNSAYWLSGYSGLQWITANSADLATKDDIAKIGFETANSGNGAPEGHPDVPTPSTQIIYLVKDSSVTGTDQYNEWIYTSAGSTTAWVKIGDTSIDLTPYQLKLSAGDGIDINQTTNVISVTGEITPYSGGNGIQVQDHVISISANYLSANALDNLSGNWENTYNTVSTESGNWNNTYTAATANSAKWTSGYSAFDWLNTNSANITATSAVVTAGSANWNNTYTDVSTHSADWNQVSAKLDSSAMSNYYLKTETSSKQEIATALETKQDTITFQYAHI